MQYLLLQIVLRIAAYMICLTFVSAPVFSQNGNLKFERISLLQGLSQNTVTSIIQDREGYLWFATLDGLNKYDGS